MTVDPLVGASFICVTTLLALAFLGFGLTRLLLPRALSSEGYLWTPFVGYTFMSIVFHALNVEFLDGAQVTLVLLGLGAVVGYLSIARGRPLSWPPGLVLLPLLLVGAVVFLDGAQVILVLLGLGAVVGHLRFGGGRPARPLSWPPGLVLLPLLLVGAAVFLVGVAPLFAIGSLTAIGKNYDLIDVYNATASYVVDYPVNDILARSPPNPLANLVAGPVTLSNGWGLSYLHAMAGVLTGRSPIETQAPVFSVMHALLVPASFVFLRRAVALPAWMALAVSAGLGLHGTVLSMLFIGLGNHVAILTLLPLVLTSTFLAIDSRRWRDIAFAGLMLTNIPLTYWPGFVFFLPPALVYVLVGPRWRLSVAPVRRGAALAAVGLSSVLLAVPGYERILGTLRSRSDLSQGWGQASFVGLGVVPGFSYWTYPAPRDVRAVFGDAVGGALLAAEGVLVFVGALLAVYALCHRSGRRRAVLASLALSYGSVLLYLRFVNPYPYAYLKAMTFAALVGVPLIALGLYRFWAAGVAFVGPHRLGTRPLALAAGGLCAALLLVNTTLTTAYFFDQTPTVYTGSVLPPASLELRNLAAAIPAGAPVFVSETPPLRPEAASALAFFLKDHPLYGEIKTLESQLSNPPAGGRMPAFGVLAASEDPTDRGYDPSDLVWSNADVRLYRRGSVVAHRWFKGTDSLAFRKDRPLTVALTQDEIGVGADAGGAPLAGAEVETVRRQLVLELATLEPQILEMVVDGQAREVPLAAGLSRYSTESMDVPALINLTGGGATPIYVRSLTLRDLPDARSSLIEKRDVLVVAPTLEVVGPRVDVRLRYAGGEPWTERMAIGLNVGGITTHRGEWAEFGWWGTDLRRSDVRISIDLATKDVIARTPLEQLRVNSAPGVTRDGDYTASLNVWEANLANLGWHSSFFGLFKFRIRDGQVNPAVPGADPVIFLPLRHNYPARKAATAGFDRQIEAIRGVLPPASRVLLGPALRRTPPAVAALAQGLGDAVLFADYLTGAGYVEHGRVYDFGIFDPGEDPSPFGYQPQDRVLGGANFVLYRRGASLAHLDAKRGGGYPRIDPGERLTFHAGADEITSYEARDLAATPGADQRQVIVTIASLAPTEAEITVGGTPRAVSLRPGVFHYQTEPVAVPTTITVAGTGGETLYLLSLGLTAPVAAEPRLTADDNVMLVSTRLQPEGQTRLGLELRWAGGGDPSRQFFAGLNLNGFAAPDGEWFSGGWWGVPMLSHAIDLEVDLEKQAVTAAADREQLPVGARHFQRRDGDYSGELSLWEQGLTSRGWPTPFIRLFDTSTRHGRVTQLVTENTELAVIPLLMEEGAPAARRDLPAREPEAQRSAPAALPVGPELPSALPVPLRTVFDEQFVSRQPGWPHDPRGIAWFADGLYRLFARDPGRHVAVRAPVGGPFRDVSVTATFRKVGGPHGGSYGLIVRDQGIGPGDGTDQGGRYYELGVDDLGRVGIWRREANRWIDLVPWTAVEAARWGMESNELTARAVGPRLTLFVNGAEVATVEDSALLEGAIGVYVGGDMNEVELSRFRVHSPEQQG